MPNNAVLNVYLNGTFLQHVNLLMKRDCFRGKIAWNTWTEVTYSLCFDQCKNDHTEKIMPMTLTKNEAFIKETHASCDSRH